MELGDGHPCPLPSGVDWTQIEERLKLTPTERLERMRQELLEMEKHLGGSQSE